MKQSNSEAPIAEQPLATEQAISGRSFVFFGSPKFAETVLTHLIDAGYQPGLVVCNPDKRAGRKQELLPPPTKVVAQAHNIPVWQPEKLQVVSYKRQIENFEEKPGFAVVAAYGKIIPGEIIDSLSKGFVGVHPSLLPKYRGPSPIRSAMLDGAEQTGVTLYLMDEKMDNGPVLAQAEYPISNMQYSVLHDKLAHLGGKLLVEILPSFMAQGVEPKEQDHSKATYTKFFTTKDGFVSESELFAALRGEGGAEKIGRKIRALATEPGVYTVILSETRLASEAKNLTTQRDSSSQTPQNDSRGKRIKLLKAHLEGKRLVLDIVQVAGKKPQPANQIPELKRLQDAEV